MTPGDTPRANLLWATLIVEELARSGVDFFCVAPGSRSTPLIAALAANERARNLVHFDERGTAYAALGYARATGRPAAWITTSGTAVANGLPAAIEAAIDGVPMILLTADRPPELRQTGANQTIDQPDIFGDYVRWRFDLPAPEAAVDPAMVLTTVDQTVYRARRAPSGPVHLNLMFREPFLPEDGDEPLAAPVRWRESDEPYTRYAATGPAVDLDEVERLREELRPVKKGLVVAGRLPSRKQGEAALRLAESLDWPLLPDVGSQVRLGARSENLVPYYDALLASEQFSLGGGTSVRGYEESIANGDQGWFGSLEVYSPPLSVMRRLRAEAPEDELKFLVFVDAGGVSNVHRLRAERSHQTLAGVGAGLRYRINTRFNLRFDYAWSLIDIADIEIDDSRAYLSASLSY